jgi:hypothetical protein
LVGKAAAAETTLGSQHDVQKLQRRKVGLQTKRSVEIRWLRRSEGCSLVDRRNLSNRDSLACMQQRAGAADRRLPCTEIRPHPNYDDVHENRLD